MKKYNVTNGDLARIDCRALACVGERWRIPARAQGKFAVSTRNKILLVREGFQNSKIQKILVHMDF